MSRTNRCSECHRRTKRLESSGRPRATCSDKCRRARIQRLRREKAAWDAQETREAEYMRTDFMPWARGESL